MPVRIFKNSRFILLFTILICSMLFVTGVSVVMIYNRALTSLQNSLTDALFREKALIELLVQNNYSEERIIQLLKDASLESNQFNREVEWNIGRFSNDSIEIINTGSPDGTVNISRQAKNPSPLQIAMTNKTGFVKEKDYKGIEVYAAYTYIPSLKWGLVAKMPVAVIKKPYINISILVLFISIVVVIASTLYFIFKSNNLLKKVLEIQSRTSIIFDNAADAIFIHDLHGNFIEVNNAACNRFGYSREELLKMDTRMINSTKFKHKVDERLKHIVETGSHFYETEHVNKWGKVIETEVNAKLVEYQGQKVILSVARDISQRKQIEQQIHVKDELLKMTSNIAKVGGWEFDPVTLKGTWTDEVAKIHGLDPSIQTDVSLGISFYLPGSQQKIKEAIHNAINNGIAYDLELELFTHNKEHKWVRTIGIPQTENGKVTKVSGIFQDITEMKEAEEALKQSRERLRLALEASNDGIWDVNLVTGKVYISPRGSEILGYDQDEIDNFNMWREILHEEDKTKIENNLKEHFIGKIPLLQVEHRIRTKSGEWKWILTKGKVVDRNANGDPVRIMGTHTDITERKLVEDELKDSEEKYRTLVEVSNEAIFVNENNTITYVNSAAIKLFGAKSADDIIGKSPYHLFHNDYHHIIASRIKVMLEEGKPAPLIEEKVIQLNGKIIDVEVAATPFRFKGNKAVLVVLRDISTRKLAEERLKQNQFELKRQNEEYLALNEELNESNRHIQEINRDLIVAKERAEESDRLKSAFLANMSHEIRTPMNAIIGFSNLLTKPGLPATKQEHFTALIQQRTYDLLRIVEDILDISKIEVGQLTIIKAETDLTSLMNDLYEYYQQKIESLGKSELSLKFYLDDALRNLIIYTDGQRLKQVLNNLLENAFKFTNKGFIEFGCRIFSRSEILFYVKDTGIGIPPEKQEIIFDRFRQAEEALSARQYGGTGLGLSIVRGIVNLLHGKVWVESLLNEGSTFYFTLPLEESENLPVNTSSDKVQIDKKNEDRSILLVEDDPANMEYLKEMLSETGLKLYSAYSGAESLKIIQDKTVDLILMDVRLPDVNGLNLTRQIKKEYPQIPVIAQTAYASQKDIQECVEAGCNDYISKPINGTKLLGLINKHLPD